MENRKVINLQELNCKITLDASEAKNILNEIEEKLDRILSKYEKIEKYKEKDKTASIIDILKQGEIKIIGDRIVYPTPNK